MTRTINDNNVQGEHEQRPVNRIPQCDAGGKGMQDTEQVDLDESQPGPSESK
jgi:hypothetical protein